MLFQPRAALRLHGVINICPFQGRERTTDYQNYMMLQAVYENLILT